MARVRSDAQPRRTDHGQGPAVRLWSRGTAWAPRVMTLAVLTAGLWGVTASRAEAEPGPIVRQFMCSRLPVIGTQPVTISVTRPALDTATVGVPTPRLKVTATGTVAAAARLVVSFLGAEWAKGTGVVTGVVDSPQGQVTKRVRFTVPRTDVATGSGPLSVSGFGRLSSMIFSRAGRGEILATGLTFHLTLLTSGGRQTFLSPFNITCRLATGQSDAVASFRILAAPAPSPNPTRGSGTRSPTSRPTSSSPSPTPSPVTSNPAPPRPTPPPDPSSLASHLLWPVGTVVVGGLAGAAWWLLRRWSAQRPAR